MRKLSILFIVAILSVISFYQNQINTLRLLNASLYLDVMAQHRIFQDCKRGVIVHPLEWKWYEP